MSEYIKKEDAIEKVLEAVSDTWYHGSIKEAINELPAADVAEQGRAGMMDLKLCPFCGKKPRELVKKIERIENKYYFTVSVTCVGCGTEKTALDVFERLKEPEDLIRAVQRATNEAEAKWNRRSKDDRNDIVYGTDKQL